jgi:hypothetical protein
MRFGAARPPKLFIPCAIMGFFQQLIMKYDGFLMILLLLQMRCAHVLNFHVLWPLIICMHFYNIHSTLLIGPKASEAK